MERDPEFHKQYASVIQKYQEEGSSRQVPDEEISSLKPIWYLPHHAVWHPRKPEEPRVVFDCACKSSSVSLNNQLLQGPENTSSLIGVILRFRVNSVAVAADIKRMFHQVFVSPEDRGALCYLWWPDGDLTKDPKTFQMIVHIFGATSSPSICGYALRRTAADYSEGFSSQTINAVMRDFYVDNLLKSFETTGQAVETTKELQELLAKGGFQLTKVMSNEREVLNAFPPEHRAPAVKDLDINLNSLPMDRALGIHWDMEADTFNLVVSDKSHPGTRKGVLSSIATIYDPLGLVGPLILPGREINQELCRLKYDWNDRLPDELAVKWRELEGCIKIHSVTFWTDSMIVLRYIFNETKRFVTFVANRVAVIREGSRPSQWRHVRSEANPADLASRGIKASETKKLEVWKHGPDFVWKDQKEWPQQPADLHQELSDQDEGVKKEKILNSRPITRVSSDPDDLEALTPNCILLLRPNPCSAPRKLEYSDKFQARWKHVHILANEFWARWVKQYLPLLQERQRWLKQRRNFKVGDLVIMKDANLSRGQWPKALVQETFPDSDGVVRQVLVKSARGVFRRDIRKLCLLEEELLKSIEESMEKKKNLNLRD